MRTTISIDDELLARAKDLASERRMTLGSVVEEALRDLLAHERAPGAVPRLPVVDHGRVSPGVDLSTSRAILEYVEDDASLRASAGLG